MLGGSGHQSNNVIYDRGFGTHHISSNHWKNWRLETSMLILERCELEPSEGVEG